MPTWINRFIKISYWVVYIYVLRSNGISRKSAALIVRYSQKKQCIFFPLFRESFNCFNFGTTGLIQVGFSAKCTSPNEYFNQIEIWKCHMFDFRLIPLDRITYNECFAFVKQKEYFHSLKDGKFHSPRQNDTLHHSRNENILTNAFNHLKMKEKRKQTNKQQHHNHSAQWKSN